MRMPTETEYAASREFAETHDFRQDITDPSHRTEMANAVRLVTGWGTDIRYCDPWGKWLCWDGKRWAIDAGCIMERYAKGVADCVWEDVASGLRNVEASEHHKLLRFATETASAKGIANMLRLARSEKGMPIRPEQIECNPWLLNVENGTIDLRTLTIREHDPRDFITKLAPVAYDPDADCPQWYAFLRTVTGENRALMNYLRRLAGYWLSGVIREHTLPFFYGSGANGKSVYLNTLLTLLGNDYAMKAPSDLLLAKRQSHPTELTDLFGKRLVACIEIDQGRRLAESLVKELTGGDSIRARRMREDFWQFAPTHKFAIGTNHRPIVRGSDNGIWRRIRLVPFTVTIPPERQDKQLPDKLKAELPGILNWALLGCSEWLAGGLQEPSEVLVATEGYRSEMDSVGTFIDQRCALSEHASANATPLYIAYKAWCVENDESPVKQRDFGMALSDRGIGTDRDTKGRTIRTGISLLTEGTEGTEP